MTTKPRMNSGIFASVIITGALAATGAWAQQGTKEPAQVSGAELQAWLSKGFVFAGEDHSNGAIFMVLGEASERTQFFFHPSGHTGVAKGTARVDGDMYCAKWPFWAGEERCREWYRVGDNKYEQREKGSRTKLATLYIVSGRTPSYGAR